MTDPLAATLPPISDAIARGIAGDRIVGKYFVGNAPERAFMQVIGGAFRDLGALNGGSSAVAAAVNASGVAVGYGDVGTGVGRGILFGAAGPQELPRLVGSTRATDINDAGVIVGFSEDADGYRRPVRFDVVANQAIDLGVLPGFLSGEANAVNAAGVAVGSTAGFFGEVRATLFADGKVTDLNTLADLAGWMRLTAANDINDLGDIVGEGLNEAGDTRAFLLLKLDSPPAPVPEPSTWGLLVLGLGTMLVLGRRHGVRQRARGNAAAA